MRRLFACILFFALVVPATAFSLVIDEFSDLISSVNVNANLDLGAFKANVSAEFGAGVPKVEAVLSAVSSPADAYMVLQVSNVTKQPTEVVIREYKANKDKGWGVIAKNLGIKPGSAEFHALKNGKYANDSKNKMKAKGGGGEKKGGGNGNGKGGGKKK